MNFVKASLFNFIASAILYLLHIATSMIQARVLGPTELGRFQLFISTQTIIIALFSFGLGQASIYYRNNKKVNLARIVTTLCKAECVLAFLIFAVLLFLVYFSDDYFGKVPNLVIVFYAVGAAASLVSTSMKPLLIADMHVVKLQLTNYITAVLSFLALVIVYIVKGTLTVNILIIIISVTNIFGALLLFYYFYPHFNKRLSFDLPLFKSITFLGIKMSLNNIAFLCIQNAPIYMISWVSANSYSNIGLYTRASSICALALFLNSTLGPLLYSKLSSIHDEQRKDYAIMISSSLLFLNIIVTFFILLFGDYIILILYGTEYIPANSILRVLAITILFSGTNELINNLLSSIGKPEYLLKNFVLTLVILIPLLYFFINLLGLIGSAVAVLIATLIKTLLLIHSVQKFIPITYLDFFIIKRESINSLLIIIKNSLYSK